MKEQIYTIPVNEAYEADCDCPMCFLERRLEREAVEYEMGAAMMEADHREESNKKGFCGRHFEMIFDKGNKLSLALVLDTHLEELRKRLGEFSASAAAAEKAKSGIFKKSSPLGTAAAISASLDNTCKSCIICEKLEYTMNRYADVLLYMWSKDENFRNKFNNSKGVCLKHMKLILDNIPKSLNNKDAGTFLSVFFAKQETELKKLQEDIHKFTLKFDYRFKDMDWGTAYDAPIRTIEKITGYITEQ